MNSVCRGLPEKPYGLSKLAALSLAALRRMLLPTPGGVGRSIRLLPFLSASCVILHCSRIPEDHLPVGLCLVFSFYWRW